MKPAYQNLEKYLLPKNGLYRQAVEALLYTATITYPDRDADMALTWCVCKPRKRDWDAIKRVVHYLKQTEEMNLKFFVKGVQELKGCMNSDWAGYPNLHKYTSGYLFQLVNSLISWSSKKQITMALSTTEADYIFGAYACQEAFWLQQLLEELRGPLFQQRVLYKDNQGCIKLAKSEKINARTKYIDIKFHYLGDVVEKNCDSAYYISLNFGKTITKANIWRTQKEDGTYSRCNNHSHILYYFVFCCSAARR